MAYEIASDVIQVVHNVLLFFAAYFAIAVVRNLYSKKHKIEIMHIKRSVFSWLAAGVSCMALAFLLDKLNYFSPGSFAWLVDLFFVASYLALAAAFAYFWYRSAKLHTLHIKEPIFIFGVVCGVFIWLYYLFVLSIIPGSVGMPFGIRLLHFFYPVAVSLIFIFTLVVHPRMKANVIRTPLWYISNGVFAYFIGYMMHSYSFWNTTLSFLPIVSSAFLLLSAFHFCIGFFAAKRKFV
jgi:hypothetical protein